ncbi:apolipoprotein N-acyltransferase [Desulfonatronospira thiodismutans ASO3-1]|uniref:Apolipoprotein N-acyltransferase n=1 Tax=Desulfonatronospira thiodismutans ASO3-1 TaxID=555779 RepID=D6SLZ4_9BACT|nr:apolipoprotein N-acyltransferase [Desulfonatronospira thiodismutans]EFI35705.1 apolipoprotein N-acyltransferase [Desulfonatronospira thiodismutans ASO3-1]
MRLPEIFRQGSFWAQFFMCLAGLFLAFPNPLLQVPFLIFLFFLGLNYIAFNTRSKGEAFRRGLLVSGPAYAVTLYWIVVPVHVYGHFPLVLALFFPLLLGFVLGLFSSLYVFVVHIMSRRFSWIALGVFGGAVWAFLEFAREYVFTGFPWLIAAQAFSIWPESIQAVSIVGSYGLAMLLACAGIWIYQGRTIPVLAALALLFPVLGYGFFLQQKEYDGPAKDILIVQGNLDQDIKWEEEIQMKTVEKYKDLTIQSLDEINADLVVWPETAMPFYLQEQSRMSFMVMNLAQEKGIDLITGAPAYEMQEDGINYKLHNRAFWISGRGLIQDHYDKERLVPFGEYIPWSSYLFFLDRLVAGPMDFSPGKATAPMENEELALGMLICYEIIFPGLVRDRVQQGANVLINISNDAWFGDTSAPRQHLHLSVLRAVEQGRYVVRSTNTGISAFIDPSGRVYESTPLFQEATLSGQVKLLDDKTFYHVWHWHINWILAGISLAGLALCLVVPAKRTFSEKSYINK